MLGNVADEGLLLEKDDVMETVGDIPNKSLDAVDIDIVKMEKQRHPCELCKKIFSNRAALNKHTGKNHPETLLGNDDPDDEGLLVDNEFDEDLSENPNKSFDVVDIETIQVEKKIHACETCEKTFTNRAALNKHVSKNHTNSVEKRINVDETSDDLPAMKKIKTNSEPQAHVQTEISAKDPLNYEYIINSSEYFKKNPKLVTTKCNIALHSMNIFSLYDPSLPSGWKMREHTKPDGESEKHFLAPDGRVIKTRRAVLEYLSVFEKYSEEQSKDKHGDVKKQQNNIHQVERKEMPKYTERKERKKTKTKLPGIPKKPMSGFFIFMQQEGRERAKKENPSATVTEIGKLVGEMWANIEDKTKWEEKTKAAKEKYEMEYKEWFENGGKEAIKKSNSDQKENQRKIKIKSNGTSVEVKPARRSGVGKECPECSKVVGNLKTHIEDMHSPPGHFPCSGCGKVYTSKNKQSSHYSRNCKIRK